MVNSKKLEDLIKESGLKKAAIAEKMGLSPYGLALKINNQNEFKVSEVQSLCEILNIKRQARDGIFFHTE